nr:uncharacterized protein LOC128702393 [Cherax quadricarinatus]XP_053652611.1 uncharacterized protein LOC128702393 [Cherax quadricarinatus]XP_053652612.1 uncharacterized protein LOC128702393 [Cherax quadricarinatus]
MYMNSKGNLDYWSTDNCCVKWSLKTGACTIGTLSLVWQALMVTAGVMMLVDCPVEHALTDTHHSLLQEAGIGTSNATLHPGVTLSQEGVDRGAAQEGASNADGEAVQSANGCLLAERNDNSSSSDYSNSSSSDYSNSSYYNSSSNGISSSNSNISSSNNSSVKKFSCPWLPEPETQVLGIYDQGKLLLVAGLFLTYSSIYCILSLCVVVGVIKGSVKLLQGWVAFTGVHNIVILVFLLVPLPFTTLPHLVFAIAHFIISLYTWAVVKSYMFSLKIEKNKLLLPEGSITDYLVDGIDVTEIPVEV